MDITITTNWAALTAKNPQKCHQFQLQPYSSSLYKARSLHLKILLLISEISNFTRMKRLNLIQVKNNYFQIV